ncbi:uncharacterized protein LOC126844906 [Adelges cooleyi]|uniref:uncharacterized protein LOC126844906 n=1 Tax=Adelges cooleyi TaxID=133065 RepID=UPI0021802366|nr:uncharacterized protein LOC126844906 [Adelges cooleyi]
MSGEENVLLTTSASRTDSEFYDSGEDYAEVDPETFHWNLTRELSLLLNMINLKPAGINKHLSMMFIREKISKELKLNIPSESIWKYLHSKWDMQEADKIEGIPFSATPDDFDLADQEYGQFIIEEGETFRRQHEDQTRLRAQQELAQLFAKKEEMKKRKSFRGAGKIRSKSDSISSVDSKDGLGESTPAMPEIPVVKPIEIDHEEAGPSTRRSLRTNDKSDDKEPEEEDTTIKKKLRLSVKPEVTKPKDPNVLSIKPINQSKETEVEDRTPSNRGRKRKNRNVSESSFSSDTSKQHNNNKNTTTYANVSDSSSRSVTPENLISNIGNQSVTLDVTNRKSNLRSGDLKSKSGVDKQIVKLQNADPILPEIKTVEKQSSTADVKPKRSINKQNETNKLKTKTRPRLTSDAIVAQQAEVQPSLGRRSCSYKS